MNSNYHLNEFYAKERMAGHLRAAQAHRQANQSGNENSSPAKNRIDEYAGGLVDVLVKVYRKLGKNRVTTPSLDPTKL